jgi:hypothetical protein
MRNSGFFMDVSAKWNENEEKKNERKCELRKEKTFYVLTPPEVLRN